MTSYDIIGSREKAVAIVEMPKSTKNVKKIANEILKKHKNIKSVLRKSSERKGVYRIRKYKLLAGSRDTEVIHKEHGCFFKLDPKKVYFSVREGTERLRVAKLVNRNETVIVMFAGVGPYPIIISKYQPNINKVISLEINPIAVKYMEDNIRINKQQEKITAVLGDVRKKAKEWFKKCDRVVMPLPQDSWKYFDLALKCINDKGNIHLYTIGEEKNIDTSIKDKLKEYKNKVVRYSIKKVLSYAPRVNKYCVDIEVKSKQTTRHRHKR